MPDDQTTIISSPATAARPPASDARGPSPETAPTAGGTTARRRWLSRRRAMLWGKRLFALSATLSTMLVAGWFIFLLGQATFRRHTVDLEPLAVPKVLDEAGFSSKVATYRLLDAIKAVQGTGRTTMHRTAVDTPADMSGVVIPKAGISVDSVAASLRSILPGGWRHEISGEFTAAGSRLDLLLRLNGRKLFSVSDVGPDAADRMIALGALIVVANTQPYVVASYLYETDKAAALAAAAQIIAALPPDDENVAWAHNLKGVIAQDRGDVDEAVRIYRQTIHDYPSFALPHHNLARIWANQHRTEDAIVEFKVAIRLDPAFASPHNSLGAIWAGQHKTEDAIVEYRAAIRLDAKYASPHNNLGNMLATQNKIEEAIAEYRVAIRLDPTFASPHYNLGIIWANQHRTEEAIVEYQAAIRLDPTFASPHYNLGLAFRELADSGGPSDRTPRLLDACSAFIAGAKLATEDSDYQRQIRRTDTLLAGQGHCPPE